MKNIDDLLQQLGGIQRHWTKERRYFVTIVIFNVYKETNAVITNQVNHRIFSILPCRIIYQKISK